MDLLIKNVNIIDAQKTTYGDVLIKNGKIEKVEKEIKGVYNTIDGEGYALLPSFIDIHTHLRDPGYTYKEDLESGQRAALKGGYTTLCAMANTNPVCDNFKTIQYVLDKSKQLNLCDIIQISSVTKNLAGKEIVNTSLMRKYTSLFSDDGKNINSEKIMKDALLLSKENDFKILTHCEPEAEIVKRDLKLLDNIGGNIHICHISRKETIDNIKKYKDKGLKFTCEVTPHHLFAYGLDYKVNPSFGNKENYNALIEGLKEGYIDVIGTDHAPHSIEDKKKGAPGISLIEVAFSMVNKVFKENDISLNKLSEMMSYNPGKILKLNTGLIKVGYEGNVVLVDLNKKQEINTKKFISKGKNNPFDGYKGLGEIVVTIKRGEILYDYR